MTEVANASAQPPDSSKEADDESWLYGGRFD